MLRNLNESTGRATTRGIGTATGMISLLALAVACGRSSFSGDKSTEPVSQPSNSQNAANRPANAGGGDGTGEPKGTPTAAPNASPPPGVARVETFPLAADASRPTDFLWIIDDSSSMKGLIGKVKSGFASLTPDKYPPNSRVAVMYTLPGDPADLTKRHPDVTQSIAGLEKAPGFLRFVRKASIAGYLAQPGLSAGVADQFGIEGCDTEWFAPDAKNAKGQSCFDAAVQAPFQSVGCEAGLVALKQLLDLRAEPVFRAGADVNVIFVSDTHDPGCESERLKKLAPNGAALRDLVKADAPGGNVAFHAIAPPVQCEGNNERIIDGTKYYEAAAATGGVKIDVCKETDYESVAGRIAAGVKSYSVKLASPGRVTAVLVDGVPAISFEAVGLDVTFRAPSSSKARNVEVRVAQ